MNSDYDPTPFEFFYVKPFDWKYHHNLLLFSRTFIGAFRHADWKRARHGGVFGILGEFLRVVAGLSTWPIFIHSEKGWEPKEVKQVLQDHGVRTWAWGYHAKAYFFKVKRRQAHWAQYVLIRHGVPVRGRLLKGGVPWDNSVVTEYLKNENITTQSDDATIEQNDQPGVSSIGSTDEQEEQQVSLLDSIADSGFTLLDKLRL